MAATLIFALAIAAGPAVLVSVALVLLDSAIVGLTDAAATGGLVRRRS